MARRQGGGGLRGLVVGRRPEGDTGQAVQCNALQGTWAHQVEGSVTCPRLARATIEVCTSPCACACS